MDAAEYARIAAVEDHHWWYRSTRALVGDLLEPWLARDQTILDAGCGPGGTGAWLRRHGPVAAVDRAAEALRFVRSGHPELWAVRGDATALPFRDAAFDVAILITVMYAVPDDPAAFGEVARVLRPGGALLALEPAFPMLRRAHDETVGTQRRYRRADLAARLREAGLVVERVTYAYAFLLPVAAALAVVDRLRPRPDGRASSDLERPALDRAFAPLARLERRRLRRRDVPFGTSVVAVGTRPASG